MAEIQAPPFRFDPSRPEVIVDPYPAYARLRADDPVHFGVNDTWYLSRYDDVLFVLRDPRFGRRGTDVFMRSRFGNGPLYRSFRKWILYRDPPDHTRVRTLLNKAFTPKVAEALRPRIARVVDDLLDSVARAGQMDLIADLAYPLPVRVICELLGVPADDGAQFRRWSDALAVALEFGFATPEVVARGNEAAEGLTEYFRALVARRRKDLQDDLLSALIVAEEQQDRLSEDELLATSVMLFFGGHETTINLLGNGLLALLRHPDQLRRLQDDPSLIQTAVEELLRYDGTIQRTGRIALEDVEIGGKTIRRGERVSVLVGSANRDPARFPNPDQLDVGRRDNHHLTFGGGIHYCVGAPLARVEAQIAITTLLARMPNLRLATDEPEWNLERSNLRGLTALPVSW